MPTLLGEPYKVTMSRTPPGMSPEDERIWMDWKNSMLKPEYNLYFDCGLGDGVPAPKDTSPEMARMWLLNTQKRADLIVDTGKEWWIVEFRYMATSNAIGRLQMYKMLFIQDPIKVQPVKLILVSNRFDPDLNRLANDQDIRYTIA